MKKIRQYILYTGSILFLSSILQLATVWFMSGGNETYAMKKSGVDQEHGILNEEDLESEEALIFLKPDLEALTPNNFRIWRRNRRTELRFSAGFWNMGSGPFEIVSPESLNVKQDESFPTIQRLRLLDGGDIDVEVGGTFFWHAVHKHYHIENLAIYSLEPLQTSTTNRSINQKTSFCLSDISPKDLRRKDSAKSRVYSINCNSIKQGLSVGWSDIYEYNFPGQSMDITNLPPGDYRLTITVDPQNRFIEETKENNTITVDLYLNPRTMKVKMVKPT